MKKSSMAVLGVVSGVIMIIMGLLVLLGVFGPDTSYASSASYIYDSGYATFGADFYNYVSNNAAEAAVAARTTAANIDKLASMLKWVFGISFIGFGMFEVCFFGMKSNSSACTLNSAAASKSEPDIRKDAEPDGELK